ncbi:MAG: DUF1840 domain-containing protein [Steroidobacter sp.]
MLVVFSSRATESITMFNDVAVELLKLMGATGRVPGALSAADVPAALARLESSVERIKAEAHAETPARPADNEDWASEEDKELDREPSVAIAVRAVPLLSVLKRAAAAGAEVIWEQR